MLFLSFYIAIAATIAAVFAGLHWRNSHGSKHDMRPYARYQATVRMLQKNGDIRNLLSNARKLEELLDEPVLNLTQLKTTYSEFQRGHKSILDLQAEVHALLVVAQIEPRALHGARELLSMRERQLTLMKKLQSESKTLQDVATRQTFIPIVCDLQSAIESYLEAME
ncbi:hypothetical protein [Aliidiomarina soli]|uniref:Uncharacterized protein n=1 Tax=Aliidiomarina soli TaxID=1928574 RepID=A0A432WHK2_9GAMM|nr:hypothetical protein [Aliidiomarina soli]RUO33197.1 hypothetical protein CWE14_08215 [Aliidiomarina soli]